MAAQPVVDGRRSRISGRGDIAVSKTNGEDSDVDDDAKIDQRIESNGFRSLHIFVIHI